MFGYETPTRRLAYRIGDRLPKLLRVIYYILLTITLVYWIYRLIFELLDIIQKFGAFIFERRTYYTLILCVFVCGIIAILLAQFYFNLDPFGKIWDFIISIFDKIKMLFNRG